MSLPGTRQQMNWFFIAVNPAQRLLENNLPNETTFRNLVSSVAFVLNSEDTADAAQTQQGLVAKALAADIMAATDMKDIGIGGNVALSVSPAQLPIVALSGGTVTITQGGGAGPLTYTLPAYLIANQGDVLLTSLVTGQVLVYNGTKWANVTLEYQTVSSNLTNRTQRGRLNFSTVFSVTDDGTNLCSTVDVAAGGISYANIQNTSVGNVLIGNSAGTAGTVGEVSVAARLVLTGGSLDIATNGVTYAKMQQANTVTLLGNPTGSTANIQEITLGASLSFSGGTLNVASAGVTYTMLQNTVNNNVIVGNLTGSTGALAEITPKGFAIVPGTAGSPYTLQSKSLKSISAATYTVVLNDFVFGQTIGIQYTATGAVSVNLPNPATIPLGIELKIVDTGGGAGTHNITINPFNTEKINGASTLVISANYGKANLMTDGVNWVNM